MNTPAPPFTPDAEIPLPAAYIQKKFGLSRTTLWRWRREGLPAQQVGDKLFIKQSDVTKFIAEQDAKAKAVTVPSNSDPLLPSLPTAAK